MMGEYLSDVVHKVALEIGKGRVQDKNDHFCRQTQYKPPQLSLKLSSQPRHHLLPTYNSHLCNPHLPTVNSTNTRDTQIL